MRPILVVPLLAAGLAACGSALAQSEVPPQPTPLPPALPAPRDVPFPGRVTLAVDATDLSRHVMSVRERIPVPPGVTDLVLLYPKWIPGEHGPTGPLSLLAGLAINDGRTGATLPWRRDPVATEAFHVPVPAHTPAVEAVFQFTSPAAENEGRIRMTPEMIDLSWNDVALYPAGYFVRDIPFEASVTLPHGWKTASALTPAAASGNAGGAGADADTVRFEKVPFDVLVDSPLLAGRYVSRFDLTPAGGAPVHLNVAADSPAELKVSDAQLAAHRRAVQQENLLYGSHHYDHYDFLLFLSDELTGEGLEHHRSSEDAVGGDYFTGWDKTHWQRDLLTHEFSHSWNGKYRRPADLWAPDYSVPERDTLLWVYEGQTEYYGQVLAERSGLWAKGDALDSLAEVAASLQAEAGRQWRTVEDTTASAIFQERRPIPWASWSRGEEYYDEGQLVWLDADTLIRQRTGGAKSLDDFARAFFGGDDGWFGEKLYAFDDVVAALNAVLPYDWAGFLRARIYGVAPRTLLDGIERGGYRLVFDDKPSAWAKSADEDEKRASFTFSVGVELDGSRIRGVEWGSPAWKAGLLQDDRILAVNGIGFDDADTLENAIVAAKADAGAAGPGNGTGSAPGTGSGTGTQNASQDGTDPGSAGPITLIVRSGQHVHSVAIDYHGGLRYPHLVRQGNGPALLDAILAPRT